MTIENIIEEYNEIIELESLEDFEKYKDDRFVIKSIVNQVSEYLEEYEGCIIKKEENHYYKIKSE